MEIAFQKAEFPCLTAAVNEVQNSEQTQELRLPDGMPDVGKVLCAWGQTILRGKEWRSDSLTVSGGMLIWVLYTPEDGSECRIVDGWLPFQLRWTLPPDTREGTIRVSALTRFADARSVSPRKLMLRAGIGILAGLGAHQAGAVGERQCAGIGGAAAPPLSHPFAPGGRGKDLLAG